MPADIFGIQCQSDWGNPSTSSYVDTVSHSGAADTDLEDTKYVSSQLAAVSISTFMEKFGDQL